MWIYQGRLGSYFPQPCYGLTVQLSLRPPPRVHIRRKLWALSQNTFSGSDVAGENQRTRKDVGAFPCLKPHWGPPSRSSQGGKSHSPRPLGLLSSYFRYTCILYNFMFTGLGFNTNQNSEISVQHVHAVTTCALGAQNHNSDVISSQWRTSKLPWQKPSRA